MSIHQNRCKYVSKLVVGTIFFISLTAANCFTAWAENSSTTIIKESPESTPKPVVRPQKRNPNSKYNIKISPVETLEPTKQKQAPDKSMRSREETDGEDSKLKTGIKIVPIEGTIPAGTSSGGGNGERQRSFPTKSGIARKIQNKSMSIDVKSGHKIEVGEKGISNEMKMIPTDQSEKAGKKYEPKMGPTKQIATESSGDVQSPISERVKVTRVQSWKLDESGNKTNEKIVDDTNVIEGTNQPPSDVSPE